MRPPAPRNFQRPSLGWVGIFKIHFIEKIIQIKRAGLTPGIPCKHDYQKQNIFGLTQFSFSIDFLLFQIIIYDKKNDPEPKNPTLSY